MSVSSKFEKSWTLIIQILKLKVYDKTLTNYSFNGQWSDNKLKINQRSYFNLLNSAIWGFLWIVSLKILNSGIIILKKVHPCHHVSHWDGSFEYPQHMFRLRNKKNIFSIPHSYQGGLGQELWYYRLGLFSLSPGAVYRPHSQSKISSFFPNFPQKNPNLKLNSVPMSV